MGLPLAEGRREGGKEEGGRMCTRLHASYHADAERREEERGFATRKGSRRIPWEHNGSRERPDHY